MICIQYMYLGCRFPRVGLREGYYSTIDPLEGVRFRLSDQIKSNQIKPNLVSSRQTEWVKGSWRLSPDGRGELSSSCFTSFWPRARSCKGLQSFNSSPTQSQHAMQVIPSVASARHTSSDGFVWHSGTLMVARHESRIKAEVQNWALRKPHQCQRLHTNQSQHAHIRPPHRFSLVTASSLHQSFERCRSSRCICCSSYTRSARYAPVHLSTAH